MKIIFAGTPAFAATALNAILKSSYPVIAVYTKPDQPAGRGRKLQVSPVKTMALAHNIQLFQPITIRDPAVQDELGNLGADVMVVAAYGLILPQAVINLHRLGCLNIHASLLPRWRGAAPIQRAIMAGNTATGISIMQIERRLDSGPLLSHWPCEILPTDTAATLHDRLAALGAQAIIAGLDDIACGKASFTPQDETQATYAAKIEKIEAELDWSQHAAILERQIRAFNPDPVAQTTLDGTIIRIWQASVHANGVNSTLKPGNILQVERTGITVACGSGLLSLQVIQLPNGRPLAIKEILNGYANLFIVGKELLSGNLSKLNVNNPVN